MYWGGDWTRGARTAPPHSATKLVTPPAIEPLTLEQAKASLKIDTDDEDEQVDDWIRAARTKVERDTGRVLLTQTWDLFLDGIGECWTESIRLPYPPLQSVTSVNQTDANNAETVWAASNYVVDATSSPGRIALADAGIWPVNLRRFQPVRIRFVAGWTTPENIPRDLIAAIKLVMGTLSENRELTGFEKDLYEALIGPPFFDAA